MLRWSAGCQAVGPYGSEAGGEGQHNSHTPDPTGSVDDWKSWYSEGSGVRIRPPLFYLLRSEEGGGGSNPPSPRHSPKLIFSGCISTLASKPSSQSASARAGRRLKPVRPFIRQPARASLPVSQLPCQSCSQMQMQGNTNTIRMPIPIQISIQMKIQKQVQIQT